MFAVIKTGGKQYRIKQGDKLRVESLDADEGDTVNLDQVLMAGDGADVVIGNPTVSSASVSAKVLSQVTGKILPSSKSQQSMESPLAAHLAQRVHPHKNQSRQSQHLQKKKAQQTRVPARCLEVRQL